MMLLLLMSTMGLVPAVIGLPASNNDTPALQSRQASSFPYGTNKVRGVNLGGWLVLEPWITPSLFEATGDDSIIDEYTFGQKQDRAKAQAALNNHWNTWIVESDFAQIAAAGLNHVRIPIGYWAYDVSAGEPYLQGQAPFLDKAIGWARNHKLKVLIDLHGAPGSQNGYDNSGQRGDANFGQNPQDLQRTKAVLNHLAKTYANAGDTVTGIELLNEPAGYKSDTILQTAKQLWTEGYDVVRKPFGGSQQSNYLVVIGDAFQEISSWAGFMAPPAYSNVALDTHHYQVFSPSQVAQSYDEHIRQTCTLSEKLNDSTLWLLVGEWSLAHTDCAKWLNGRGRGARYEGQYENSPRYGSCAEKTGNGSNFSQEYNTFLRKFFDIQVQTYERFGQGWYYWTWKNEEAADWSYQEGVKQGWIPRNPGDHINDWDALCGNA